MFTVLYYNDFFKPPKQAKQPLIKSTTVRFRDEVRVKKIKAKGKNLPVSTMYENGENEDEDEDEGDDSWGGIKDDAGSEDDDPDMEESEEDGSDDSDDVEALQRGAISRVKDDLFADYEDEEELQEGT